jgi:hypothetical protein
MLKSQILKNAGIGQVPVPRVPEGRHNVAHRGSGGNTGRGQKTPIGVTQGCGLKLIAPMQEGQPDIGSQRHEINLYQQIGPSRPLKNARSFFKSQIFNCPKKTRGTVCRAPQRKINLSRDSQTRARNPLRYPASSHRRIRLIRVR